MESNNYIPILIQLIIVSIFGIVILTISQLLGQKSEKTETRNKPYECGVSGDVSKKLVRFSVRFYLTAMLFILFDIEIIFLIPMAIIYQELRMANVCVFLPTIFFLISLITGIIYESKKKAMEWEK